MPPVVSLLLAVVLYQLPYTALVLLIAWRIKDPAGGAPFCSGFSDTVFRQYRRAHFFDHLPGTVCDILQLVHSPAIRTAAVTRTKRGFFRFLFPGLNSNPGLSFEPPL